MFFVCLCIFLRCEVTRHNLLCFHLHILSGQTKDTVKVAQTRCQTDTHDLTAMHGCSFALLAVFLSLFAYVSLSVSATASLSVFASVSVCTVQVFSMHRFAAMFCLPDTRGRSTTSAVVSLPVYRQADKQAALLTWCPCITLLTRIAYTTREHSISSAFVPLPV